MREIIAEWFLMSRFSTSQQMFTFAIYVSPVASLRTLTVEPSVFLPLSPNQCCSRPRSMSCRIYFGTRLFAILRAPSIPLVIQSRLSLIDVVFPLLLRHNHVLSTTVCWEEEEMWISAFTWRDLRGVSDLMWPIIKSQISCAAANYSTDY